MVQERGLDFASEWDAANFRPAPRVQRTAGEAPLKGGPPRRRYGQGYFVYTGLFVLPAAPRGRPRGLPPVRETSFHWENEPAARMTEDRTAGVAQLGPRSTGS